MGFSTVMSNIASGAIADAVAWVGDLAPLLVLVAGVLLLGLVLAAVRGMLP